MTLIFPVLIPLLFSGQTIEYRSAQALTFFHNISIHVICVNRGEEVFQNLYDLGGLWRGDFTQNSDLM
jgi:hypothetical protein